MISCGKDGVIGYLAFDGYLNGVLSYFILSFWVGLLGFWICGLAIYRRGMCWTMLNYADLCWAILIYPDLTWPDLCWPSLPTVRPLPTPTSAPLIVPIPGSGTGIYDRDMWRGYVDEICDTLEIWVFVKRWESLWGDICDTLEIWEFVKIEENLWGDESLWRDSRVCEEMGVFVKRWECLWREMCVLWDGKVLHARTYAYRILPICLSVCWVKWRWGIGKGVGKGIGRVMGEEIG